jgi:hypothetical protein
MECGDTIACSTSRLPSGPIGNPCNTVAVVITTTQINSAINSFRIEFQPFSLSTCACACACTTSQQTPGPHSRIKQTGAGLRA